MSHYLLLRNRFWSVGATKGQSAESLVHVVVFLSLGNWVSVLRRADESV